MTWKTSVHLYMVTLWHHHYARKAGTYGYRGRLGAPCSVRVTSLEEKNHMKMKHEEEEAAEEDAKKKKKKDNDNNDNAQ